METKTINEITHIPNSLGWQERARASRLIEEIYGKKDASYSIFQFVETETFVEEYKHLNKEEERMYVCHGNLDALMSDLEIWKFGNNSVVEVDGVLTLNLTRKNSEKEGWFRKPDSTTVIEGVFYQLTAEEFEKIPFTTAPITKKRDIFLGTKLYDNVLLTNELRTYLSEHLTPIRTTTEQTVSLKYRPIIVEKVKGYVPSEVDEKALLAAITHDLTNLEFNFLNYFYLMGKAMRNDVGQLYFDEKSKGIGWGHSRDWVKKKMARLIELGLVKFESRHDCRDPRYTSWYFYDANKNLNNLKHDF